MRSRRRRHPGVVVGHGNGRGAVGNRRGSRDHLRVGLGLGAPVWLRFGLGLVDDRVATEPFGVGQTADAVGRGVVDARRVALHADLELLGEIEHHLVLDAELSRQLVDADLLRCQAASSTSCYTVLHAASVSTHGSITC
jgi:hypothetical protein